MEGNGFGQHWHPKGFWAKMGQTPTQCHRPIPLHQLVRNHQPTRPQPDGAAVLPNGGTSIHAFLDEHLWESKGKIGPAAANGLGGGNAAVVTATLVAGKSQEQSQSIEPGAPATKVAGTVNEPLLVQDVYSTHFQFDRHRFRQVNRLREA